MWERRTYPLRKSQTTQHTENPLTISVHCYSNLANVVQPGGGWEKALPGLTQGPKSANMPTGKMLELTTELCSSVLKELSLGREEGEAREDLRVLPLQI